MADPIQTSLPMIGPAPLVAGPVFLEFEWEGKPPHKGRHRSRLVIPKEAWTWLQNLGMAIITKAGVKKIWIQHYADNETEAHEKAIAEYAGLLMRGRPPSTRPLAMLVHAFREIPVSWSDKDREAALVGGIMPTSRPDADNYLKLAKDALNKIVYLDDSQVVDARCIKVYSDKPALRVELREFWPPGSNAPPPGEELKT